MITIRRSADRGKVTMGWLDSRHSFSFGHYFDPAHMGFGNLRVINEDWIRPGKGFGTHPHDNMEILTYVVEGALEHRDSMDNGSVIRPHDVQRMTAGTGVTHSEFNHSTEEPVHLLQIWILPETRGLEPGYEEKRFARDEKRDRLRLIASRDGRSGSVTIHQDADLYASVLSEGAELTHLFRGGRRGWLQVVTGEVTLDDVSMSAGDGAAIEEVDAVTIRAGSEAEFLLFDLG